MTLFSVTVHGDSGKDYTVAVNPRTKLPICSCPAFYYGKNKPCKHIRLAADALVNNVAEAKARVTV